jgi:hypothetical protein
LVRKRYPRLAQGLRLVHPLETNEYFAYHPDTGTRYEMNEVSFRMVGMMTGDNDVAAICSAVRQEFSGAESIVEDVETLLQQLVREGCVIIEER